MPANEISARPASPEIADITAKILFAGKETGSSKKKRSKYQVQPPVAIAKNNNFKAVPAAPETKAGLNYEMRNIHLQASLRRLFSSLLLPHRCLPLLKLTGYPILLLCLPAAAAAQNKTWNGKKAAVVLTYDDALNVHLSQAVPALDSLGLKGTFYISDYFGGLQQQLEGWKAAAARGHELGNHTVHHPCAGSKPGRSFVQPDYDLDRYSLRRLTDEIRTMNTLLKALDGKTERTFAFPCSDTRLRDTPYINGLKNEFVAARAVWTGWEELNKVDLYHVSSFMVNGQSGAELIALAERAVRERRMLVFLFHGVGGEHSLNVSLEAHRQLLHYLKKNEKDIWIAPMLDVARFIRQQQLRTGFRNPKDGTGRISYTKHNQLLEQPGNDFVGSGLMGNPSERNAANHNKAKANHRTPAILPAVPREAVRTPPEQVGNRAMVTKKLSGHGNSSSYTAAPRPACRRPSGPSGSTRADINPDPARPAFWSFPPALATGISSNFIKSRPT